MAREKLFLAANRRVGENGLRGEHISDPAEVGQAVEKRDLALTAGRVWVGGGPWRAMWNFLEKVKIELPPSPAIPHLGFYQNPPPRFGEAYAPPLTAAPIPAARPRRPRGC